VLRCVVAYCAVWGAAVAGVEQGGRLCV